MTIPISDLMLVTLVRFDDWYRRERMRWLGRTAERKLNSVITN
jgi:hypothetical protein